MKDSNKQEAIIDGIWLAVLIAIAVAGIFFVVVQGIKAFS